MFEELRAKYRRRVFASSMLIVLVWLIVIFAPYVYSLAVSFLKGQNGPETSFQNESALLLLGLMALAPAGLLGGVPYLLFGTSLLRWQLGARPVDPVAQSRQIEVLERLSIATGLPAPQFLVMDSDAVNAAAFGRRRKPVIVVTSAAMALPKPELEALLALALARQVTGHALVSRYFAIVSGPNLIWLAVARLLQRHPRFWFAVPSALSALSLLFVIVIFRDVPGGGVGSFLLWFFVAAPLFAGFALPFALPPWLAVQALALQVVRRVMAPASKDIDVGAVALTRYPVPLVALLTNANQGKTSPGFWSWGTGGLWCLPRGRNKTERLNDRLAALVPLTRINHIPLVPDFASPSSSEATSAP